MAAISLQMTVFAIKIYNILVFNWWFWNSIL